MKTEHQNITGEASSPAPQTSFKEKYHAPQITIHGKLERMTLQDTYPVGGGGGGGGLGNTAEE